MLAGNGPFLPHQLLSDQPLDPKMSVGHQHRTGFSRMDVLIVLVAVGVDGLWYPLGVSNDHVHTIEIGLLAEVAPADKYWSVRQSNKCVIDATPYLFYRFPVQPVAPGGFIVVRRLSSLPFLFELELISLSKDFFFFIWLGNGLNAVEVSGF